MPWDWTAGKSVGALRAEANGRVTIGRWARKHGVSAAAAMEVMRPTEYHHAGKYYTKIYYLPSDLIPSADEVARMREFDAAKKTQQPMNTEVVRGWHINWIARKPYLALYHGPKAKAPKKLQELSEAEYAEAQRYVGRRLRAYACRFDDVL